MDCVFIILFLIVNYEQFIVLFECETGVKTGYKKTENRPNQTAFGSVRFGSVRFAHGTRNRSVGIFHQPIGLVRLVFGPKPNRNRPRTPLASNRGLGGQKCFISLYNFFLFLQFCLIILLIHLLQFYAGNYESDSRIIIEEIIKGIKVILYIFLIYKKHQYNNL